jgi:DNA-directed RNA polymerase specialized sigma24 family protein
MYGSQYRSLVRLAVLLVGDLRTAEDVVQGAFAAMHQAWRRLRSQDAALSFLHRSVVTGSRSVTPEPALASAPRYEAPTGDEGGRPLRAVPPRAAEPAGATDPAGATKPAGPTKPAGATRPAGATEAAGATERAAGHPGPTGDADPAGVIAALRRLPVMQREALALRLYLDLSDDQIAAAMQVDRVTARSQVASGLAALRGVA